MDNSRDVKVFAVEEYHRGKWIPVFSKETNKPKIAKISVENAELLTGDAMAQVSEKNRTTMFRYVERKVKVSPPNTDENKPKLADLREEYPNIKATSVDAFLAKIEESKK